MLTASGYEQGCSRPCFVALILVLSELVELPETIPPFCRHPGDDQIIACAVAGEADVIVSGDRDLLVLERVGGIPILPPDAGDRGGIKTAHPLGPHRPAGRCARS
jgi:hypothetical protein